MRWSAIACLLLLGSGCGAAGVSNAEQPLTSASADGLTRCFASAYDEKDKDAAFARCEEQNFGTEWRRKPPRVAADSPPPALGSGHLDPQILTAAIKARIQRMRGCYHEGLRRDATLRGDMRVRFVIDTTGHTLNVENVGSHMRDKQVLTCVLGEVALLRFPRPEGGIVTVVYPLVISPGDT